MKILLIAYDNGSHIHWFPMGLAYVASAMRNEGHNVEIYNQDVHHYPEEHLKQYLNKKHFDAVGLSMCAGYYQYAKFKKIISVIPPDVKIWLGGQMFAPEKEYFSQFADYICEGEYDYKENVDDIALPAWDLFPMDYYSLFRFPRSDNTDRCLTVLSGRGCPFRCTFCYRMVPGYRPRSPESIVDEIKILKERYRATYILFNDELLMVSPDRIRKLSEALKPLNIRWGCCGRLNYAKPKILRAMKDAGCVFINYGVECLDDKVLRNMNKNLTVEQITRGVESTLESGISPGLNVMWGNVGDTIETLHKTVDFVVKYSDDAQLRTIRPVTPYPGCDLYYYAIKQGLLGGVEDFYENKHVNSDLLCVNFTEIPDDVFHEELRKANDVLVTEYYKGKLDACLEQSHNLYNKKDTSFRGFRQI